jgi:hypothetical protein
VETDFETCHISGMTKTPKRPRDVSQLAKMMVDIASGESNQTPVEKSGNKRNLGGEIGGRVRAQKLSPLRRKEISQKAAAKRWEKQKLD